MYRGPSPVIPHRSKVLVVSRIAGRTQTDRALYVVGDHSPRMAVVEGTAVACRAGDDGLYMTHSGLSVDTIAQQIILRYSYAVFLDIACVM